MNFPEMTNRMIAHRGSSIDAPENTLPAYQLAKQQGFDFIEVDVQLTLDGTLVMMHDKTVNRTTDGDGFVSGFTLDEIRKLDASHTHKDYSNTKIPTLEETIQLCLQLDLGLILEIKPVEGLDYVTAIAVADMVKKMWPADNKKLIVSSFSAIVLQAFKPINPHVSLALATMWPIADPENYIAMLGVDGFHLNGDLSIQYGVDAMLKTGAQVIVATVNDKDDCITLLDMGVHGVMTDVSAFAHLDHHKNNTQKII